MLKYGGRLIRNTLILIGTYHVIKSCGVCIPKQKENIESLIDKLRGNEKQCVVVKEKRDLNYNS